MEEGRRTHEALEKRVAANVPLPPQYKKYEPLCQSIIQNAWQTKAEIRTELKVAVNRDLKPTGFFDKDVYGRGAIDVTTMLPDLAFVGDWKTGKTREKDFQVRVFAFFMFLTFPTLTRVDACNIWLPTLKVGQLYRFYREDLPKIWSEIFIKLAAMENAAAAESFPPRPSPLCGRIRGQADDYCCPVTDCEHNPKYGANHGR